jgi:NAD(P)-dependent dehydrogenase (short-subunit alcohol dehydrogenase family)
VTESLPPLSLSLSSASSIAEFRVQIETNLFGTVYTTKAPMPVMRHKVRATSSSIRQLADA